jgi:HupE / UreJ protein
MHKKIKLFEGNVSRIICVFFLQFICFLSNIYAHPMPNTDIAVRLDNSSIEFEIKIPVPELLLALPQNEQITDEKYFREHIKILSKDSVRQPYNITSLEIATNTDEFVGDYQELNLVLEIAVNKGFNPRDFLLEYDAVIHQVPNHFALVKITSDFNNGILSEEKALYVGAVRYDFQSQKVPLFVVNVADNRKLNGFYNMVMLGMNHILMGFDHVLFLLTLLIVSPLAVKDRSWTLFQGNSYTFRRFFTISLAFTLGHSVSLIFGAFKFLPINQRLIEILVAASILITAIHAITPIFSRRESFAALGFGLIHGIAFAEVLTSLHLTALPMAISIFGFNLGIEIMQLIIMAVTFPFLLISRYQIYSKLRLVFGVITAILAGLWIVERLLNKTL